MPFLILPKQKEQLLKLSLLSRSILSGPIKCDIYNKWRTEFHKRRQKQVSGVDISIDKLMVRFNKIILDTFINTATDEQYFGIVFGCDKSGFVFQKYKNMTAFVCIGEQKEGYIQPIDGCYDENGNHLSFPNEFTQNYKGRFQKLNSKFPNDFTFNETTGIYHKISEFKQYYYIVDKYIDIVFVKDSDKTTAVLISDSIVDPTADLDCSKFNGEDILYDQGTGCCPI